MKLNGGSDERDISVGFYEETSGGSDDFIQWEILTHGGATTITLAWFRSSRSRVNKIIRPDDAFVLLKQFKWCGDHVLDNWFNGTIDTSLYLITPSPLYDEYKCDICLRTHPIRMAFPLLCGHRYCRICLREWLKGSIEDGPSVLLFHCPEPGCGRTLGTELIKSLARPKGFARYMRFAFESYVVDKCNLKWCPFPQCNDAVTLHNDTHNNIADVECSSFHTFCWKCSGEGHYPVDCTVAKKWLNYHHDEESGNWRTLNTKLCPKCSFHRDGGCKHISCTMCKFQFCWFCLRQWTVSHECSPSVPQTSKRKIPQTSHACPPSVAEEHYRRLFQLREKGCQIAKMGSRRFQTDKNMRAWFEIRRCRSIFKWICVLAHFYRLDMVQFHKLEAAAKAQLKILVSFAFGKAPNCIQKARNVFEEMVAKLHWEGQWNLE